MYILYTKTGTFTQGGSNKAEKCGLRMKCEVNDLLFPNYNGSGKRFSYAKKKQNW